MSQGPVRYKKLSVIVPVYNEQSTIQEVIDRVLEVDLGPMAKEIIISDDGSTDRSPEIIERAQLAHSDLIHVHTSMINVGKGAAIRFALEYVSGDIVIFQDADLELDPREYDALIRPIVEGRAEVVYGSRFKGNNRGISFRTRFANVFLTALTNILFGSSLTDMETAYKVFKADVIRSLRLRSVGFNIEPEITAELVKAGYAIYEVPVSYSPRTLDEGKKISWIDGIEAIYTLIMARIR